MSGEGSSNISRKGFLKLGALALAIPYLHSCNLLKDKKVIPIRFAGANSKTGHLLRTGQFPAPAVADVVTVETLVVGGGVSGLSAARYLHKNNYNDFVLLELDTMVGGNAKGGKNAVSEYPYGAHYLPLPNEKFSDLITFLHEHNIVTGFDDKGLPIYNEDHLCAEPQERLHYKGLWHEGLPPKTGMSEAEKNELLRFLALTESYKSKTWSDQKPAFTIPVEWSSEDEALMQLDKLTMAEFLKQQKFETEFLHWYINYCCKDDFGTSMHRVSAWAAMHYFSSRNGKAANAGSFEQLVWPEGNHFLVKCLKKEIAPKIKAGHLVYKVEKAGESWQCLVFDVNANKSVTYNCKNIIFATPQFVNKRLLGTIAGVDFNDFAYYPWLTANITINNKFALNGLSELCWDNVSYDSKSLGYVNACHQTSDRAQFKTVLTYYYNFSENAPKAEREFIYGKDENYWKEFIISDLQNIHEGIEELIDDIELYAFGHGMISPVPGFRNMASRKKLAEGFDNLQFVNSDVSGISIFEQAFYRGTEAAKNIINSKKNEQA